MHIQGNYGIINKIFTKEGRATLDEQLLTAERLGAALAARGCDIPFTVLACVDSTNSEAKRRIAAGDDRQQLLLAREQTGGRGRMGRSFFSPAETGLYMTLTLGRAARLRDPALLTIAAATATADAIEALTGAPAAIKWVNDIYMAGRKVCGILCEAVTDGGGETAVLAGIGVNVATENFPEELRHKAGALPRAVDRAALAAEITARLLRIWDAPEESDFLAAYRARSFIMGRRVRFLRDGAEREALALAIDDNGALLVRHDDGREEALRSGEVSVTLEGRTI